MNKPAEKSPSAPPAPKTTKPKQPKGRAAQSFRADEVNVVVDIMTKLMQGGDPSTIGRSDPARRVYAKFVRMKQKLEER
jgi:hypothetical protein